MLTLFENIGRTLTGYISVAVSFLNLCTETAYWVWVGHFGKKKINVHEVFSQMVFMGIKSIVIVFFVCFFTGIVLAMQSAHQLEQMGAVIYVASLVSISICRELGPVLTALVMAGKIGSAITAEISSMKVNEQIEALEAMAINPVRYIVVPKLLALVAMLPCLTVVGDMSGIFGGYIIGVFNLGISHDLYLHTVYKFLTLQDIYTGISKSFVFAVIIAMVGAYTGFQTKGGAVGVGRSTTISVVASFILIIVADCIVTGIYYFTNL